MNDKIKTQVIGHIPPRYQGEPKSSREIHRLIEKPRFMKNFLEESPAHEN